jgi:hypothetical protein
MPTFKTPPELDSAARSPFDDLNRLETANADQRAQDRLERVLERNGGNPSPMDRQDRGPVQEASAPVGKSAQSSRNHLGSHSNGTDPLIDGLFSKLPTPESEWPLAARQKWLQTAANIFDLMYAPGDADAGELAIRVERGNGRI